MMYVRWLLQAPILLSAYIFCYLTCWLWAGIAAAFKLDKLPGAMAWVHTHDDTVYGSRYRKSHSLPIPESFWARWTAAMWWICRNPAYGFAAFVLGFPDSDVLSIERGKPWSMFKMRDGSQRFSYAHYGKLKIWVGWQPANQAGWHIMKFNISPNPDD